MPQNYKIFVNNTPLILTDDVDSIEKMDRVVKKRKGKETIHILWNKTKKEVSEIVRKMEKPGIVDQAVIASEDMKALKETFFSLFTQVKAAGGIVINNKNEILTILRNNKWDLPKGKMERGEMVEQTAIREVKEETGLREVHIIQKLNPTYHTYREKGKAILKTTIWFEMGCVKCDFILPQVEEGITIVKWVNQKQLPKIIHNTYNSIADLLTGFLPGENMPMPGNN